MLQTFFNHFLRILILVFIEELFILSESRAGASTCSYVACRLSTTEVECEINRLLMLTGFPVPRLFLHNKAKAMLMTFSIEKKLHR